MQKNRSEALNDFMNWSIRAVGAVCAALLVTGFSQKHGWLGIDVVMIILWMWNEHSWDKKKAK